MCSSNCLNSKKPGENTAKVCFLWHSWIPRLFSYKSVWSFRLVRELRYLHNCEIISKCMYLKSSLRSSLLRCEICFLERPNGIPVIQCSLSILYLDTLQRLYNTLESVLRQKRHSLEWGPHLDCFTQQGQLFEGCWSSLFFNRAFGRHCIKARTGTLGVWGSSSKCLTCCGLSRQVHHVFCSAALSVWVSLVLWMHILKFYLAAV